MVGSIQPLHGCSVVLYHSPALHAGLFEFNPFGLLPNSH